MTAQQLSQFLAKLPPETEVVVAEEVSLTMRSTRPDDFYNIYLPITAEQHLHACFLVETQVFPLHTKPEELPRGARPALLIGPHLGVL